MAGPCPSEDDRDTLSYDECRAPRLPRIDGCFGSNCDLPRLATRTSQRAIQEVLEGVAPFFMNSCHFAAASALWIGLSIWDSTSIEKLFVKGDGLALHQVRTPGNDSHHDIVGAHLSQTSGGRVPRLVS